MRPKLHETTSSAEEETATKPANVIHSSGRQRNSAGEHIDRTTDVATVAAISISPGHTDQVTDACTVQVAYKFLQRQEDVSAKSNGYQ